ncbi:ribosomal RNA processing protein 1 homolog A-like isoform X2 [Mya arenaria]|uniref:ribosomal RNA processing protein 1 homolog A-like isoform X2 n=1 Tax=Mya arenaria TaxID=6604 RepID=UPI0022E3B14E|nr:ribosomal RNA processing protein 1 homolog A-like isoform X2 [Mya arenaria]
MANIMPVEVKFAQNLAGNEKKTRFKAVKKLKKYLRAKSSSKKDGFTKDDLLKIWKGLHYCMWMQDKPVVQEELSTTLTKLVHELASVEAKMLFIKVFFLTEAREWNSIDVWRLDKFMMMVRNMLEESLIVVRKLNWGPSALDMLVEIYADFIMNPNADMIPDGLKIHFSDIFLEEVEKTGGEQLNGKQLLKLLQPFITYLQFAKNVAIQRRVISRVFEPILERAAEVVRQRETSGQEESDVPFMALQFDNKLLADHMFAVSQDSSVLARNRPLLYNLVKRLQDIEQGALPRQKHIVITPGVTNNDMQKAVSTLIDIETNKKRKRSKKKKKSKEESENNDPNNNAVDESDEVPGPSSSSEKTGKRKHSLVNSKEEPLTKIKKKDADSESKGKKFLKDVFKTKMKKDGKAKADKSDAAKDSEKSIEKPDMGGASTKIKLKDWDVFTQKTDENQVLETKDSAKKAKKRKSEAEMLGSTTGTVISAMIPTSMTVSRTETVTRSKLRHGDKSVESNATPVTGNDSSNKAVPEIVVSTATPTTPSVQTPNSSKWEAPEEGEVEIFVPNKKFKKSSQKSPAADFAVFDSSKPPAAFVRKAYSKVNKPQTPTSIVNTPGSAKTRSNKRVSFDMKKNKAQGFKESLNSPLTPFVPTKKPDQGILKSPNSVGTPIPPGGRKDTPPSPRTQQIIHKVKTKRQQGQGTPVAHVTTPVLAIGQRPTPMKRRPKAADFFL